MRSEYIDGWDRLTLGRYELMLGVEEGEDANLERIAIANGKDLDYVLNCPIGESLAMGEAFQFIQKPPKVKRMKKTFTLNGREYYPVTEPSKITTAQYIDYDQLENKKDLTAVLACVLIPVGHTYNDGYDYQQAKEDIRTLSVEEAVSICDFFTRALSLYALNAIRLAIRALKMARKDGMDVTEEMRRLKETRKEYARRFLLGLTA